MKFRWHGTVYQGQLQKLHDDGSAEVVSRQHGPRFVPGSLLLVTKDEIVEVSDEEKATALGVTMVAKADALPIAQPYEGAPVMVDGEGRLISLTNEGEKMDTGAQALDAAMAEERQTLPPVAGLLKKAGELQPDAPHQGLSMQHLRDKMALVGVATKTLGAKLEARADRLLARAAQVDAHADKAFAPHEAVLDQHEAGLREIEDAATALGNGGPTG